MAPSALADQNLRSKLNELVQLVEEVQNERDQLRAKVQQLQARCDQLQDERNQLLHAWADRHITEEELDRRSQESGGGSLAEVLARLEKA
jgi:uncharacterized coiled-coil DUF342 family protein